MPRTFVHANEATAAQRRVYFDLRDATDGLTAETGEGGGQPQISTNGGSWTNTGIGTLTHIGSGRYYADLAQAAVATAGDLVETRYKSANTAESPGDSVQVVGFDPADTVRLGLTALPNAAADAAGGLPISDAGELDLDMRLGRLDATLTDRTLAAAEYATLVGQGAIVADTEDIQARLPNSLTSDGYIKSDALAVSGDVVAASNLETMLDGTGGQVLTLGQLRINSTAVGGAIDIDNSGGPAISARNTGSAENGAAVDVYSNASDQAGLMIESQTGNALHGLSHGFARAAAYFSNDSDGPGIEGRAMGVGQAGILGSSSTNSGLGIHGNAGSGGYGIMGSVGLANGIGIAARGHGFGAGISAAGGPTGHGIEAAGGSASGDGIRATTSTGKALSDTIISAFWSFAYATVAALATTTMGRWLYDRVERLHDSLTPIAGAVDTVGFSPTTTVFRGGSALSAVDDFYNGSVLVFTSGALAGQARRVVDYVGSTRQFTLDEALTSAPANAVAFTICPIRSSQGTSDAPTVEEIDAQLSSTHGAGLWGAAGASGARTITVTVENGSTGDPLPGAQVTVKNSTDTTIVDQKRTSLSGVSTFSLDDATYRVHVSALPGFGALAAQTLVVTGNASVTYELDPLAAGTPSAGTRTVHVIVYGPSGQPVSGEVVTARLLEDPAAVDNALLAHTTTSATTDVNGLASLTLVTRDQFEVGTGLYEIYSANTGKYQVTVPAGSGAVNLQDLL